MTETTTDSLSLAQMDVVLGTPLGSAQIDQKFEKLTLQRLREADANSPLGIDLEDTAWQMMKSKEYQNAKCDYGSPDDTPTFSVAVPKLDRSYGNEQAGIVNGEMVFRRLVPFFFLLGLALIRGPGMFCSLYSTR